jgi:RsiW-degrading membrane proteinase PrsW (M82 family)
VTYYTLDDSVSGEAELMTELSVSGGDHENAFRYLYDWHSSRENYKELHQLMGYDELAQTLFSPSLARTTNLVVGDFPGYVLWLIRSITNDMTVFGFFAAALISLIWMMYASRLDKIVPHRYWMMFLMFVGGSIFTFLVLPFSDIMEIQTQWYRTGDFFNDLLYCVLMIAVPEETVKILPLLILVAVGSKRIQPIDYIIYACASALGFAFIENILYFGGLNPASIHGRAYLAAIGHMVDTSIVAYGFVLTKFRHQNEKPMRNLLTTFSLACLAHGLYDFFIFQELILLFFIFFILVVQFWIIMINNCLNNSSRFTYFVGDHYERSKVYLTLSLVAIMSIEYVRAGWVSGALEANLELAGNSIFAIFLLTFFSSSLSSFDLVKGYWRKITFINHEKRGYGTRSRVSPLMSWYLVNAIRSHNYIGKRIVITNHPFNATLAGVIYGKHHGKIVNRVILYKDGIADPYWFIVKLVDRIPFADDLNEYILVKLRYQEDYMEHDDEVEVFFKAIRDPKLLRVAEPPKDEFPFYGWALMSLDRSKKQIPAETPHFNSQKIN